MVIRPVVSEILGSGFLPQDGIKLSKRAHAIHSCQNVRFFTYLKKVAGPPPRQLYFPENIESYDMGRGLIIDGGGVVKYVP